MKALLLLAVQVAAVWPTVHWYYLGTRYASPERYQLVALAAYAVFLCVWSRQRADRTARGLEGPALGVLVCAVAGALYPGLIAAILAVVSVTWTASVLCTERRFHFGLFGLGLLALPVLPLFQVHLGLPLRLVSAEGAAGLLRMGGIDVLAAGAYLDEGGALVGVDAPCAGLGMLWTGLLVTFVAANLWNVRNLAAAAGALCVTLIVVAANALRTAALFLLATRPVAAPSWIHPAIGLLLELVVILAILWFMRSRAPERCATT